MASRISILVELTDAMTAPLRSMNKGLGTMRSNVRALRRELGPLGRSIVQIGAALAGGAVLRRSVQLAERQVQAQAQLARALGDNIAQMDTLLQKAAAVQARTTFGDEELIELTAFLLDAGVGLGQIDKAIEATLQTSSALGQSLNTTGKQLAQTLSGDLPARLARLVPELNSLSEEALLSGAAFDVLAQRFEGAAEALAATDFGTIKQQINLIGDELEIVGQAIAGVLAEILPAIVQVIRETREWAQQNAGTLKAAAALTLGVLAGAAAFKTLTIAILATKIALIPIIALLTSKLGLLAAGMATVVASSQRGRDALRSFGSDVQKLIGQLQSGDVTFGDIFAAGADALTVLGRAFLLYVAKPIERFLDATKKAWNALDTAIGYGFITIGNTVIAVVGRIAAAIAAQIDSLFGGLADAASVVSETIANAIRIDLAGDVKAAFAPFEEGAESAAEKAREAQGRLGEAIKQYGQLLDTQKASAEIEALQAQLNAARVEEFVEREKQKRAAIKQTEDEQRAAAQRAAAAGDEILDRSTAKQREREQELQRLRAELQAQQFDAVTGQSEAEKRIRLQALLESHRQGLIAAGQFGQEYARLALDPLREQQEQIAQRIVKLREEIAQLPAGERRNELLQQEIELGREWLAVKNQQIEAVHQLDVELQASLERQRQQLNDLIGGPMTDFFTSIIDGTKSVKESFGDMLRDIAQQLARFVASALVQRFIALVIGGGVGGGAGAAAVAVGAALNSGGLVPGSGPDRDSVPAMLTPHEYVISRRAVKRYGIGFLNALNAGLVPRTTLAGIRPGPMPSMIPGRWNSGGPVDGAGGGGGPQILPAVAATEGTLETLLTGGRGAMLRFLREHRSELNSILGSGG